MDIDRVTKQRLLQTLDAAAEQVRRGQSLSEADRVMERDRIAGIRDEFFRLDGETVGEMERILRLTRRHLDQQRMGVGFTCVALMVASLVGMAGSQSAWAVVPYAASVLGAIGCVAYDHREQSRLADLAWSLRDWGARAAAAPSDAQSPASPSCAGEPVPFNIPVEELLAGRH